MRTTENIELRDPHHGEPKQEHPEHFVLERDRAYGKSCAKEHDHKEPYSFAHPHRRGCPLTFNHLPKNHLIWRVSLRLGKFAFKFIGLATQCARSSLDRLRAEGQVPDLSGRETPHGARGTTRRC